MSDDAIWQAVMEDLRDLRRRVAYLEGAAEKRIGAPALATQIVHDLAKQAAAKARIPVDAIYGNSRRAHVSAARQWVMFEARAKGLVFEDIGDALGRDHTTIISGCVEERIRRAKRLPNIENLAKIEAGRGLRQQLPDPDHEATCMIGATMADNGHYPDSGSKINSVSPPQGAA